MRRKTPRRFYNAKGQPLSYGEMRETVTNSGLMPHPRNFFAGVSSKLVLPDGSTFFSSLESYSKAVYIRYFNTAQLPIKVVHHLSGRVCYFPGRTAFCVYTGIREATFSSKKHFLRDWNFMGYCTFTEFIDNYFGNPSLGE